MGTTTRGNRYPESTDNNDVPRDIRNLANDLNNAPIDTQGLYINRPAAGQPGRYYWATDEQCLYRDDGTAWWQTTPGKWKTFTVAPVAMSGPIATVTMDSQSYARYRVFGNTCQVKFMGLVHTTAPAGYDYGIAAPFMPRYDFESGTAVVQNIPGMVQARRIGTTGTLQLTKGSLNLAGVSDLNGSDTTAGYLHISTFDTYDRFHIEYEI